MSVKDQFNELYPPPSSNPYISKESAERVGVAISHLRSLGPGEKYVQAWNQACNGAQSTEELDELMRYAPPDAMHESSDGWVYAYGQEVPVLNKDDGPHSFANAIHETAAKNFFDGKSEGSSNGSGNGSDGNED